ncbi:prolyl oligopeptidase family serine peptidase [Planobispora takensis]|uniref:prolyl oligopeptidase n=1 Tax=Planobispora takensis TaxID=1367882 RepID=A0A8J3SSJ8_9ACTN|nr:prolyl oligopeptidase family serine peptidase [Planobispora takensis]GIH99457.1 prolyl endopeptidase [Planobispora takensis]
MRSDTAGGGTPRYPDAERLALVEERHGLAVRDPYRWLEDGADPRTGAWLSAQEELYAASRPAWRAERWHRRLASLHAVDLHSPPVTRGGRSFFSRRPAGGEHPRLMVASHGRDRPLVDPAELDPAGLTVLDTWRPSVEGDLLAYQLSSNGTEESRLWVMDTATGRVLDGPIDRVRRSAVAWLPGGTHFYYVRRLPPGPHPGEERYHRRVFLHRVGSHPDEDIMIFGEGRDGAQFYTVSLTADGRWLSVVATQGTDRDTEVWLADLTAGPWHAPALRPVQEGVRGHTRLCIPPGAGAGSAIWLRTTRGAPYGRVMTATPSTAGGGWRELIAERPGSVLTDFAVLTGARLPRPLGLASWVRHAVSEITVHDLTDGTQVGTVPLPGAGSAGGLVVSREGGHEAWFSYSDHLTPWTVLHYDGRTGVTRPWRRRPSAVVTAGARTRHVAFRSADGTTVRMFVLSPEGRPDRPRPAVLTGYGGFGAPVVPAYSPEALAWVRAGGVWAVACLRGGGEEGEEWHHAGRGAHKQNVFDDFAAAADHLVEAGWTGRDRLGIMGGSNGGLLVGAAITQHPEKYAAAVCMSPLLDMARYELHGLGPSWRPEYGSADEAGGLRTLLAYSPYHHVRAGTAYPPVLFTVAETDTRVDPLHARKMCAALQHASPGPGPVLLRHERDVGHGERALSRTVALQADCLAFLAAHLGLRI